MKREIEKALQTIPVPDLENSVRAGIARAERNGITMTRSVKKIAAISAAVVVICAVAVITVMNSRISVEKVLNEPVADSSPIVYNDATEDISLQLCGISDTNLVVRAAVNDAESSRLGGLTTIKLGNYTVVDKDGNVVADNEGLAGTYQIDTVVYKLDKDGNVIEGLEELHEYLDRAGKEFKALCDALEKGYKLHVSSLNGTDEDGNPIEIYGDWESELVINTVLDGSAFVADDGDVSVEFVTKDDGSQDLVITMNDESKYPYSDVVTIWPTVYFTFDEDGNMMGATQGPPSSRAVRGGSFGKIFKTEEDGQITIVNAEYGHYTMRIYDLGIELANGERYELQGFWEASFDGNREPLKEGETDEQYESWKKEYDAWVEEYESSMSGH